MKRYIACYDISSNSKRLKIMKKLKNDGFHAQLSFFEIEGQSCNINAIKSLMDTHDRFALIRLNSKKKIKRIGGLFEKIEWVL